MIASLLPSDFWAMPAKQRLGAFLAQAPARCRVAPSPTGHVHLGTIRTALHNFLAARASGGHFLLRIDDTDRARNDDAHVDLIHRSLSALGLTHDQVFHQSTRRDQHLAAADILLANGWAVRDGSAVRLASHARTLAPGQFFDLAAGICPISQTFLNHADDLVLIRSDGAPTYHFASVVDDIDSQITLILRGADHLPNTPKQLLIALALAQSSYPGANDFCNTITFAHVGLILKDGKKLSKRDAASNLTTYLDDGTPPNALLQWALNLGWGHPDSKFDKTYPLIDLNNMPTLFAQGGVRAINCNMSQDKLVSLKRKWLSKT